MSNERKLFDLDAIRADRRGGRGSGTGDPPDDMEPRVAALEKGMDNILGKLDDISKSIADGRLENEKRFGAIEGRLTGIETALDSKATTASVAEVSGKVSNIPTTWQTVAIIVGMLVGIAGVSFTISKLNDTSQKAAPTSSAQPTGKTQ